MYYLGKHLMLKSNDCMCQSTNPGKSAEEYVEARDPNRLPPFDPTELPFISITCKEE